MKSAVLGLALALAATGALADDNKDHAVYEVSITNITKGQTFTPQLIAIHTDSVALFELGAPASDELAVLAEGGSTAPLTELLQKQGRENVGAVTTIGALLAPGATAVAIIEAPAKHEYLSSAGMLIPTNDTFFAVNRQRLPKRGAVTAFAQAYDAGTEANDQKCSNIPGPRCGGAGLSAGTNAGDEGFVHIGNGFHELGAGDGATGEILRPFQYDWRNPVAMIRIKRLR
jgi:Spondin_N